MYSLNIGKLEHLIRYPILISVAFLALLKMNDGYIDCRISCRRCHENTEHPSVLEVYCAMCEECKQRRREKMQGKTGSPGDAVSVPEAIAAAKAATLTNTPASVAATDLPHPVPAAVPGQPSLVSKKPRSGHTSRSKIARYGIKDEEASEAQAPHHGYRMPGQPMLIPAPPIAYGYPGCPPLTYCSESEEVTMRVTETTTHRTTTTTTRPTTPCPTRPPCKRKKVHQAPVMAPMMMPMMVPCMPCTNLCQAPCPIADAKTVPLTPPHQTSSAPEVSKDYQYVFIGIPKNIL